MAIPFLDLKAQYASIKPEIDAAVFGEGAVGEGVDGEAEGVDVGEQRGDVLEHHAGLRPIGDVSDPGSEELGVSHGRTVVARSSAPVDAQRRFFLRGRGAAPGGAGDGFGFSSGTVSS